jgi:hypothetical protein
MTGDGQGWHSFDFNDVVIDGKTTDRQYLKVKVPIDDTRHRIFPKWDIGDILWVRETLRIINHSGTASKYWYKADACQSDLNDLDVKWKPSIFMPKEACRIFLEITGIRVERLKSITEQDAISEGVRFTDFGKNKYNEQNRGFHVLDVTHQDQCLQTARTAFGNLWEKINGPHSWNDQVWVWVIEFKRIEK